MGAGDEGDGIDRESYDPGAMNGRERDLKMEGGMKGRERDLKMEGGKDEGKLVGQGGWSGSCGEIRV